MNKEEFNKAFERWHEEGRPPVPDFWDTYALKYCRAEGQVFGSVQYLYKPVTYSLFPFPGATKLKEPTMKNTWMPQPAEIWDTGLKALQREVPTDVGMAPVTVLEHTLDYASSGLKIALAVAALDEGMPGKQKERCQCALNALKEGTAELERWMFLNGWLT